MEINLRKFEFGDLPKLSKILKKMEIKDDLKKLFSMQSVSTKDSEKEKERKEKLAEEMGAEFGATAVVNLYMAEAEIFELIAGLTGLKVEEVKKMELDDIVKLFKEFGKSAGSLVSFFKSAVK
jgi:acetylornithine deacetylase/succinyl-diaminopimelate desuccinylase-like protein